MPCPFTLFNANLYLRDMLSEYEYWQFWRNTADGDVVRFLKLFTDLPMERIRLLEQLEGSELNDVKRLLADECTRMLHGDACLEGIHAAVDSLFSGSGGGDLDSLPHLQLHSNDLDAEGKTTVAELLFKVAMVGSKGEGKRLIKAGGVKVNDCKVDDEYAKVGREDFDEKGRLKLSMGKKKHAVAQWPQSI